MQLAKLSSSNPKFKTLEFKPGLNIISGLQLSQEEKKSINGIGKSLSLKIIHYIFGSSFNSPEEKKLESFLKAYGEFKLEFSHNNIKFEINKNFNDSHYFINGEKIPKTNYPDELTKRILGPASKISFKQVFNAFARRYGGSYYNDPLTQQGRPKEDYYQKFVNLVLLGIDVVLVERCNEIKTKVSKLEKAESAVKEYERSQRVNPKDISDKLDKLTKCKSEFIIAENHDQVKLESEKLTAELDSLRNKEYEKRNIVARKQHTLSNSVHMRVDLQMVENVFKEVDFFFGDKVTKRLEDAEGFHQKLIDSRRKSLTQEIAILKSEISEIALKKEKVGQNRDKLLKELDKRGAFEEYNSLCDQIRVLENELAEARKYRSLLEQFNQDKTDLELENAQVKRDGLSYLKTNQAKLDSIEEQFRTLVKSFYDNTGGSLEIKETQDARYLFEIEPNIPKDGSQGVGEVKIFCYDILLFLLNKNLLGFLAHDGCIFSEMDKRQKSMIFKVAIDMISKSQLQYFINIGENSLDEVLDKPGTIGILSAEEKQYIQDAQILKLYDKNPESWLFGEDFN